MCVCVCVLGNVNEQNFHLMMISTDDYFDTEDPSVNLHEFIINSMQVQCFSCMS